MAFKGIITAATSIALVTAPTMAAAQTTAATTQEVTPATETVDGEQLRGGFIVPLIAIIAVILGLCVATDICGGDDSDPPTSP